MAVSVRKSCVCKKKDICVVCVCNVMRPIRFDSLSYRN